MNIQKGGEKNFLDYIEKYPTVNKDLITALNNPDQELVNYLDKAPVIIICIWGCLSVININLKLVEREKV